MTRLIRSAACALVCLAASLFPASLEAQNTSTNVTLSSVLIGATGSTSTPMPYGTVCAVAVNAQGVPVTITATGWGLVPAGRKFCGKVVNGAIAGGFSVPDSLHTNASAPIAYNLVIQQTDGLNGNPVGSPTTINTVYGITGASFALDAYAPPVSAPVTSTVLGYGASVPTSCTAPSIWTTTTGAAYVCSNGAYVALSGGSAPASTGVAAAGQVRNLYADVARQSANNSLQVIADTVVDQNKKFFTSDGTPYWTAATGDYAGFGVFAEDFTFSVVQNPAKWSGPEGAAAILNIANKIVAAKGPAGQFPASVTPAGVTPSGNCSGFDQNCAYWSGVGWAMVPLLCYEHYLKTGTTTCYSSNVAAIKTALLYNPRNPVTHVITISTGASQSVPFSLFLEQARPSGDNGNAAVLQAISDAVMGQMATAAGDTANINYFNGEFSQVTASIASELLDPSTSMVVLGTGQDHQIDVLSSGMAVWFSKYTGQNIVSPTVQTAISNYLHTNLASLTYNGYFLNSPTPWAVQGIIPAGGGTAYANPAGCTNQMYHNGYWSLVTGMAAYAISLTHPEDVPGLLASFRDAANPAVEYYNRDHSFNSASCGTAETTNLESPQGASWAAANLVGPTPIASGAAVVNMYNALVNGTGVSAGLSNPANVSSTQVFNGGAGVPIPVQASSDSTVATVISARNTTSNTNLNFGVNGTGQGAYSGVGVVTMSNGDGSAPANVQAYDRANHWTGIPSNYSYRWHSGLAGSTSTDTGFSRNAAGSVSVDGSTVGDGLGALRFTILRSPSDFAIAPASTRRIIVGPAGFTHAINAFTDSALTFDNGTVNSPAAHFYYGNNVNFGFDTSSAGAFGSCSGQIYRFIHNAAEAGGAVVACLDVSGNYSVAGRYGSNLYTPGSSSEACSTGSFWDDANYHYVCTATNTIKRVALSSF